MKNGSPVSCKISRLLVEANKSLHFLKFTNTQILYKKFLLQSAYINIYELTQKLIHAINAGTLILDCRRLEYHVPGRHTAARTCQCSPSVL